MKLFLKTILPYIEIGIAIFIISTLPIVIYSWHYQPIKALEKRVTDLENQLTTAGNKLNECEAKNLQDFIDAIGEHNEVPNINLLNLHT
jgi:hypothetical protein